MPLLSCLFDSEFKEDDLVFSDSTPKSDKPYLSVFYHLTFGELVPMSSKNQTNYVLNRQAVEGNGCVTSN